MLRSDLLSADQMEQHGVVLAARHQASMRPQNNALLTRLAENADTLAHSSTVLTQAVYQGHRITPAAEWLLDNDYLIEEQIRTAQRDLPKGYSRELPWLINGPSANLPRVYDIALETIVHADGRLDGESLRRFVAAYQTVTPLKLGELWAVPIMLRLGLIENLRRVAVRVMAEWGDRNVAGQWADRMAEVAESDPKSVVLAVADMARSGPPMACSFVAELTRRLQGQGPALALALTWVEQALSESGNNIERLVQLEAQQQAADQVTIGNSIGSLRTLSSMDWRTFVESMSHVEQVLRQDPAGIYAAMDFTTRDHYRHVVERLAKRTTRSEGEVALAAVDLASHTAPGATEQPSQSHVGYFLIDRGLAALEQRVAAQDSARDALRGGVDHRPIERVRHGADELARGVARQLRISVQGDDVLDLGEHLDAAHDLHKPRAACAAQQTVELGQLAALALVTHPHLVGRIPAARPVQQKETVGLRVGVAGVERVDALGGLLQQRRVGLQHFTLGIDKIGKKGEVQMRVAISQEAHLERIGQGVHVLRTAEHGWNHHEGAHLGR